MRFQWDSYLNNLKRHNCAYAETRSDGTRAYPKCLRFHKNKKWESVDLEYVLNR